MVRIMCWRVGVHLQVNTSFHLRLWSEVFKKGNKSDYGNNGKVTLLIATEKVITRVHLSVTEKLLFQSQLEYVHQ